jgi:endonuclease YncB( thermonuclease family)
VGTIFDFKHDMYAEAEAKKASTGMWALRDKYISPKEWRRMNKK